jgi:hypothetical protein
MIKVIFMAKIFCISYSYRNYRPNTEYILDSRLFFIRASIQFINVSLASGLSRLVSSFGTAPSNPSIIYSSINQLTSSFLWNALVSSFFSY